MTLIRLALPVLPALLLGVLAPTTGGAPGRRALLPPASVQPLFTGPRPVCTTAGGWVHDDGRERGNPLSTGALR